MSLIKTKLILWRAFGIKLNSTEKSNFVKKIPQNLVDTLMSIWDQIEFNKKEQFLSTVYNILGGDFGISVDLKTNGLWFKIFKKWKLEFVKNGVRIFL